MHQSERWNFADGARREIMVLKLGHAIRAQELRLFYQPVIDVRRDAVIGFEALLRWTDQIGQAIPPSEFVPLAEQAGLMPELGRWTLFEACNEAVRWPGGQGVAVNVSAAQLDDASLIDDVGEALRLSGLPAHRLEIELTETASLEDKDMAARVLADIHEMGVGIALDDFGTCYSSLSMVQRLPLTRLKIDRSFVEPIDGSRRSLGIARSVMELASAYDLAVTAEGVETLEQMQSLAEIGCCHMQGYLFGRPQPIAAWLNGMAGWAPGRPRNRKRNATAPLLLVS